MIRASRVWIHRPSLGGVATALLRAAWWAAIMAVVIGSLLPAESLWMRRLDGFLVADKLEHTGMYALLVFLPALHERRSMVLKSAVGAVALGVGLEIAQLLTGWRDFEVADMAADAVGVGLGLSAGLVLRFVLIAVLGESGKGLASEPEYPSDRS